MQGLVYVLMTATALALAVAAWLGLGFTPVEALLVGLFVFAAAMLVQEIRTRRRSEAALETSIEALRQVCATHAQTEALLSQRVKQLVDERAGKRLEALEADVSVLGTVVRQIAEAVAELEPRVQALDEARRAGGNGEALAPVAAAPPPEPSEADLARQRARRQLERVTRAMGQGRIVFRPAPLVTLPQRRLYAEDLVAWLESEGEAPIVFSSLIEGLEGADGVRTDLDRRALEEAVAIRRRAHGAGQAANVSIALSRASLADPEAGATLLAAYEDAISLGGTLDLRVAHRDFLGLSAPERELLAKFVAAGASIALDDVATLRLDVAGLAQTGVGMLRIEAARLLEDPAQVTDFHVSDLPGYLARFGMVLCATGIGSEREIVELLEDGVTLVCGPHINTGFATRVEPLRQIARG